MSNTVLPRAGAREVQDLADRVERALNALEGGPLANAVVLPPQLIGTGDTRVYTGLGRAVQYYWVVRATADVRVFDGAVPEATDPGNYVSLRASSEQTVALAVI